MTHRAPWLIPVMMLITSCATQPPQTVAGPPQRTPERRRDVPQVPGPSSSVQHLLDSLPLRDKVAQLIMPWLLAGYESFDSPEMHQALRWVDSFHVGGIIISIGSPIEMAAKLNALQRAAPLPLLVASDLEGGTTIRFSAGGTPFPTQMGVGAGGREEDAYQMGRITALEGRAVGIHLAFAPVADVNSNPENPIINTRSFGGDPTAVGKLVAATIRGMHDNGILATAKHFPGHGDTETDSHLSLPTITAGWERFDSQELVPFRAAIAAGVDAVMSAHIALPGLDPGQQRPGTLAPPILTGILRDSLHFQGLVATDALNMGAIVKEVGADEAPVLAFLAGSDLLLMPTDVGRAIDAMVAAVESGRISRERLDVSVRKVLEMKERIGLFKKREVDITAIPGIVGREEFRRIALDVTRRSITLIKDSLGAIDSMRAKPQTVTLVVYSDPGSTMGNTLATELRRRGHSVKLVRFGPESTQGLRDSVMQAAGLSPMTIVATSVRVAAYKGTISLPPDAEQLITVLARHRPTILVSFGSPYLIAQVPTVPSYMLAWTANALTETAVAEALSGGAITGRAPIDIPPAWRIGAGLQRPGH